MKKLFFALAVLSPSMLFAQSPFDGTWKTMVGESKFSPKPITFVVSNGAFDDSTEVPKIHAKADGQDQPVSEHPFDTIRVTEMDDRTVHYSYKRNGRPVRDVSDTVSADGKTLHRKCRDHSPSGTEIAETDITLIRVGEAPASANATSGTWRIEKVSASENSLLATLKRRGEEFSYSNPAGETWSANLDGKEFPVKGAYDFDTVSLKQLDVRKIEAVFKREGKLIEVRVMTVSPEGKRLVTVVNNKVTGRVATYVAEKQ